MTKINFLVPRKEVLGNQDLKLEELNVQLVTRIEGRKNPVGKPTHMPVQVRGMVDVAKIFQPEKQVTLIDENGERRDQTIDYHSGVATRDALVQNFDPDQVVNRMQEHGELYGLLKRLRIKKAALDQLRKGLDDGNFSKDTIAEVLAERDRFQEMLKSAISTVATYENLPDFAKDQLIEGIKQVCASFETKSTVAGQNRALQNKSQKNQGRKR